MIALPASGFSWFHLIPGVEEGTLFPFAGHHGYMFVSAWFVSLVLIAFAAVARSRLQAARQREGLARFHADDTLTVRSFAELIVGFIQNMMNGLLEKKDQHTWMPLIGGLFLYIITSNLLAVIPGFQPPTDNINANIGMAVISLLAYWGAGLIRDPKYFVHHITGPVLALAWLVAPIELLGLLLIRPATLSVRLTGNMFGDHTVFNIMSDLVPLGVPVVFLALALLVSAIQAFVFALLTTIYISLALPHGDHH